MATEMWSGYPPEVNSGRWEAGTGPETWMAASAIWTEFAGIVMTATASLIGEIAMMTGSTLSGSTSVAMMASSVPFVGWLASMEALALTQAAACATVAAAWSTATAGIIPLPVVTQNRITEAALQASNFFGVNTPAIAELNRQYGQFWTQDAMSMMNYDQAVVLATTPKMAPPPPPLSSMTGAAELPAQAAQTAANAAQNASKMSEVGQGMQELIGQGAQSGDMSSMMSSMMGPMQSMMGAANPSQLGQGMQSMMGPMQSMMGQFMSGPQMGGGLNGQFGSSGAFTSTGGVPLGMGSGAGAGMGAGGGGMGMGGGGGAPLGTLNSASQNVKPISNLSGVPAPTMGSGNQASNSRMMGGGGMGPMGGMGAGSGQQSSRKSDTILAAHVDNSVYDQVDPRQERAMFR